MPSQPLQALMQGTPRIRPLRKYESKENHLDAIAWGPPSWRFIFKYTLVLILYQQEAKFQRPVLQLYVSAVDRASVELLKLLRRQCLQREFPPWNIYRNVKY